MSRLQSFHRELRRRKVYRVGFGYAAVAFAVWQAADIAFPSLGLPDAAVTFVLALTIVAFPLALVLAWAYEVQPDAGPSEDPVATAPPREPDPEAPVATGATRAPSIAILPFENMSTEPGSQYFADGITEELTHVLGRVPSLRVAARTSAFVFKGERVDVREIGTRLNVAHVVEGSVRRSGDRLRVTAQLVDTRNGYHVWSDRYERLMDDVFSIQDEIVEAVADSLRARFATGEASREPPQLARTDDLNAYDLYLRARYSLRAFDGSSVADALDLVEQALERDPRFAPALAARAEILTTQAIGFFQGRSGDLLPRARSSADQALAVDPDLPEAHLAKALVLLYHDRAFAEARAALDRALALNPSNVDAHRWSEFYWTYVERDYERAMAALSQARTLDPMDGRIDVREATVEYLFGRFGEAESMLRGFLADHPDSVVAKIGLMDTLSRAGAPDEAARLAAEVPVADGTPDVGLGVPGVVLALAGEDDEARLRLRTLEARRERGYALPFWRAVIHAALGELDDAFQLMDEAVEERDGGVLYLAVLPPIPGLQDDPRFGRLLRRVGLGHLVPDTARG